MRDRGVNSALMQTTFACVGGPKKEMGTGTALKGSYLASSRSKNLALPEMGFGGKAHQTARGCPRRHSFRAGACAVRMPDKQ